MTDKPKDDDVIIIDYEPTEKEEELDLLDRKCEDWVKGKLEKKNVD